MSLTKRSTTVPVAFLSMLSIAGCANAPSADGDTDGGSAETAGSSEEISVELNEEAQALLPEDIRTSGVLVVASDPTYPPFEFMAEDKTTLKGFDIDLTDMLAQSLGLRAEHQAATFDTILPGLSSGKYDVGASSFTITEDRKKAVDFVPYFASGTALAVPAGNPEELAMDDGSLCGRSVAAQKGTIQALEQLPEFSKNCVDSGGQPIDIQTFPLQSDANLALVSGRVDGVLSDSASLAFQGQETGGKFELASGEDYEPANIGVATPKDSELTDALAEAMEGIVASDAYDQLFVKWELPDQGKITSETVAETTE